MYLEWMERVETKCARKLSLIWIEHRYGDGDDARQTLQDFANEKLCSRLYGQPERSRVGIWADRKSTRESRFHAQNAILYCRCFQYPTLSRSRWNVTLKSPSNTSRRTDCCRQRHSSSPWNRFTCVHVAHTTVLKNKSWHTHTHKQNTHRPEYKIHMNYTWILCMNEIANCAKRKATEHRTYVQQQNYRTKWRKKNCNEIVGFRADINYMYYV